MEYVWQPYYIKDEYGWFPIWLKWTIRFTYQNNVEYERPIFYFTTDTKENKKYYFLSNEEYKNMRERKTLLKSEEYKNKEQGSSW